MKIRKSSEKHFGSSSILIFSLSVFVLNLFLAQFAFVSFSLFRRQYGVNLMKDVDREVGATEGALFQADITNLTIQNFLGFLSFPVVFFSSCFLFNIGVVVGVQGQVQIPLGKMEDGVWFIEGIFLVCVFLTASNPVFLIGTNGAGKSTILEAISWCQFNKFLRSDMKADFAINDTVRLFLLSSFLG
jgi:hypothetical protein